MKLASFRVAGRERFGVVTVDGIIELNGRLAGCQQTLRAAMEAGVLEEAEQVAADAEPDYAFDEVEWQLPIPKPEKIYCVGQNYAAHIREMGYELPEYPSIFTRFPRTFVPHKGNMIMPSHSEHFDYEGEMTVVIGTKARHVSEAEALDYVAGYTICNDGSVRDWQKRGPQVSPGKNWESSGMLGPWITTSNDAKDPGDMFLKTWVNGELRQDGHTGDLVFSAAYLISYISTFITLMPGDMITTGSPSGVAVAYDPPRWLEPGDHIEIEIETLGKLAGQVIDI
ncbi:MAG: fumarylacetoacetate hydrolase family protein [Pseudomonadota bacterium]|nr:fumarylacetoacetate hydrolase family protein [Pseudomonadota bacterium]